MKKIPISLLIAAVVGIAAAGLVASEHEESHEADERGHNGGRDHDDGHERAEHRDGSGSAYLDDPGYTLYKTECGSCHLAYPPALLPAASWRTLMGSLEDHFGDNAGLDAATARRIADYLARHAAGEGRGEYADRSWRATRGRTAPLRATETDYFLGQHHEIPAKMVTGNPEVGSFSRCESCHQGAEQGNFDEQGVRIPGYGHWDN